MVSDKHRDKTVLFKEASAGLFAVDPWDKMGIAAAVVSLNIDNHALVYAIDSGQFGTRLRRRLSLGSG
jgi:hypothetical protein